MKDFSLSCEKGEITGLLGLNGAGKTTILKAICARHFATSGTILVDGINPAENAEAVRNLTGFVQEEPNLPGEYTVREYLHMVADLHGASFKPQINTDDHRLDADNSVISSERSESRNLVAEETRCLDYSRHDKYDSQHDNEKKLHESVTSASKKTSAPIRVYPRLINSLSLTELLPKKIKTLSKGQRERVNFAQALIYNPSVLVLDEPASGLDPAQILSMRSLVKSLKADHTILLSTHLMQEVEALCDRVYIIHEGKCAAEGTPGQIARDCGCETLEEAFFKITKSEGGAS